MHYCYYKCSPPPSKQSGKKAASTLPRSMRRSDASRDPIACLRACSSFLRHHRHLPSTPCGPRVLPQNTNRVPSLKQWWPKSEEGRELKLLCVCGCVFRIFYPIESSSFYPDIVLGRPPHTPHTSFLILLVPTHSVSEIPAPGAPKGTTLIRLLSEASELQAIPGLGQESVLTLLGPHVCVHPLRLVPYPGPRPWEAPAGSPQGWELALALLGSWKRLPGEGAIFTTNGSCPPLEASIGEFLFRMGMGRGVLLPGSPKSPYVGGHLFSPSGRLKAAGLKHS